MARDTHVVPQLRAASPARLVCSGPDSLRHEVSTVSPGGRIYGAPRHRGLDAKRAERARAHPRELDDLGRRLLPAYVGHAEGAVLGLRTPHPGTSVASRGSPAMG